MEPRGTPRPGIRERLLSDHSSLERLLAEILAACEANDRERVAAAWSEFDRELLSHMDLEERCLIPSLFRADERAARTLIREHQHIRQRLLELGAAMDLHVARLDTVRAFARELGAHARNEDRLLYRWVEEHMKESDLVA